MCARDTKANTNSFRGQMRGEGGNVFYIHLYTSRRDSAHLLYIDFCCDGKTRSLYNNYSRVLPRDIQKRSKGILTKYVFPPFESFHFHQRTCIHSLVHFIPVRFVCRSRLGLGRCIFSRPPRVEHRNRAHVSGLKFNT